MILSLKKEVDIHTNIDQVTSEILLKTCNYTFMIYLLPKKFGQQLEKWRELCMTAIHGQKMGNMHFLKHETEIRLPKT